MSTMFMYGFGNFFLIKSHGKEVIDSLRLRRARFTVHLHNRIIKNNENTLRYPTTAYDKERNVRIKNTKRKLTEYLEMVSIMTEVSAFGPAKSLIITLKLIKQIYSFTYKKKRSPFSWIALAIRSSENPMSTSVANMWSEEVKTGDDDFGDD